MERPGTAWPGGARRGKALRGGARQGLFSAPRGSLGGANRTTRRGMARLGLARPGAAGPGKDRQGKVFTEKG